MGREGANEFETVPAAGTGRQTCRHLAPPLALLVEHRHRRARGGAARSTPHEQVRRGRLLHARGRLHLE